MFLGSIVKFELLYGKAKCLHKKTKSLNTEYSWAQFRTKRNEVTKAIKKAKADFKNNIIVKINNNTLS